MPLISGGALSEVAAELSRRKVKLCHACQLADLRSYLEIGGVPSRNLLAVKGLPYTAFDTDMKDRRNGVWTLVFFNLSDFGHWFAAGKNTIPNPFGPVLLCFDPIVMFQALDVSIALRSAGAKSFDRTAEGISVNDVPRLFIDANSRHIRFSDALREEFGCSEAQSPEMSCSFCDELAPVSHLAHIIVDPYCLPGSSLPDIVRRAVKDHGGSCRVFKRWCADACETRYQILLDAIIKGVRTAHDLVSAIPDESPLASWRDQIVSKQNLSFQFERYAAYLSEGTIHYCV